MIKLVNHQVHDGKIEYTMLYYDGEGREVARMIWDAEFRELWALLYKAYDFRGNETDRLERFQYYGGEDGPEIYEVRWHYDYDRADRVTKVSFRDGELPWQTLAQYSLISPK